jgi:hypothetical protein
LAENGQITCVRGVTLWHLRLFLRALAGAALAFGLILLLSALTDEGGLSLAVRLGRAAPMTPVAAALGTGAALAPPRWRGELLALSTLGQRPTRSMLPAVLGAAMVGALVGLMLVLGGIDAHGFFPVVPKSLEMTFDGTAFVEPQSGVRILPNGELATPIAKAMVAATSDLPRYGIVVAGLATLVATLGLAMVAAVLGTWARPLRALLLSVLMVSLLAGFQASASSRVSSLIALVPAFALFSAAFLGYRKSDELMALTRDRTVVAPLSRRSG